MICTFYRPRRDLHLRTWTPPKHYQQQRTSRSTDGCLLLQRVQPNPLAAFSLLSRLIRRLQEPKGGNHEGLTTQHRARTEASGAAKSRGPTTARSNPYLPSDALGNERRSGNYLTYNFISRGAVSAPLALKRDEIEIEREIKRKREKEDDDVHPHTVLPSTLLAILSLSRCSSVRTLVLGLAPVPRYVLVLDHVLYLPLQRQRLFVR